MRDGLPRSRIWQWRCCDDCGVISCNPSVETAYYKSGTNHCKLEIQQKAYEHALMPELVAELMIKVYRGLVNLARLKRSWPLSAA